MAKSKGGSEMTPEELMKPRYKVIADYPKSIYLIGNIINAGTTSEDCIYCDREGPRMRHYPHLFKKLEWWEERKIEEMPEYVKGISPNDLVYKMVKWTHNTSGEYFDEIEQCPNRVMFVMKYIIPATREEYEQYTNKQKEVNNER